MSSQQGSSDFIELVWGAHNREKSILFEVQSRRQDRRSKPKPFDQAKDLWLGGTVNFFGVVPRKEPENDKEACVDQHDVLWVDADLPRVVNAKEARQLIEPQLKSLGIAPSAIVYSGRAGLHLYWKLDRRLPIERIQGLNKALASRLDDGDPACWNCNRILRIPGTLNEKVGGGRAELLLLNPDPISVSDFDRLGNVPPIVRNRPARPAPGARGAEPEWLRLSRDYDHWGERDLRLAAALTNMQINFLRRPPAHGWSDRRHRSRSEMEMTIAYRLISKGWSDLQIKELADFGFPHHMEWSAANPSDPDRYIDVTLANARQRLFETRRLVSSPVGGSPRKAYPKKRPIRFEEFHEIDRLVRGQTKAELVSEAIGTLERSRATAYRRLAKMEEHGLIVTRGGRVFRKQNR